MYPRHQGAAIVLLVQTAAIVVLYIRLVFRLHFNFSHYQTTGPLQMGRVDPIQAKVIQHGRQWHVFQVLSGLQQTCIRAKK